MLMYIRCMSRIDIFFLSWLYVLLCAMINIVPSIFNFYTLSFILATYAVLEVYIIFDLFILSNEYWATFYKNARNALNYDWKYLLVYLTIQTVLYSLWEIVITPHILLLLLVWGMLSELVADPLEGILIKCIAAIRHPSGVYYVLKD